MALGLNVRVNWILDTGVRWPGLIVAGPENSPVFPGEFRWGVRLDANMAATRWLEGRDLVEAPALTITPEPVPFFPDPVPAPFDPPLLEATPVAITTPPTFTEPGADLRDPPEQIAGIATLAMALLRQFMRNPGRVTLLIWQQLPGWAQVALRQIGIVVGTELTVEAFGGEGFIPGIGLPDGSNGTAPVSPQDGQPFIPGVTAGPLAPTGHMPFLHNHIVGSWIANGVTFYRLFDGKLAVQNKKGRWKVWRPKKPIVIMPTGAVSLKVLLRADAVLNRQSKKIAAMLNRRAPRRKSPARGHENDSNIIVIDGKAVKSGG